MNEPTISMSLSSFIAAILSAYRTGLADTLDDDEPEPTPPKETMQ